MSVVPDIKLAPPPTTDSNRPSIDARVHEAAGTGRRIGQWGTRAVSPSGVVSEDQSILINRSRASTRDDPWISRASVVAVASEIGIGIVPRPTTGDDKLNKSLLQLWKDQVAHFDYTGKLTVYAMQALASQARKEAGESFIIIHRLRADRTKRLPVPLQFQLVESEFCPIGFNRTALESGNSISQGVELNKRGQVVAYWFYKKDPRDGHISLNDLTRYKADDVIHHFKPSRPGQLRGLPENTRGIVKAYTFEGYNDAELERKRNRAQFTGVIERPDYGEGDFNFDPITGEPMNLDHADVPIMDLEPGTFSNALPGEHINLFNGDDAGRGYSDYQKWQLLGISAGVNIPYALISGDFSEINDRLWRAIINQFKREIQLIQESFIIPQICAVMWNEFVDRAIISGAITKPVLESDYALYRATHRVQAWESVHPLQDAQTNALKVEKGFKSRAAVVDQGNDDDDVETLDEQRKIDSEREDSYGLGVEPNVVE